LGPSANRTDDIALLHKKKPRKVAPEASGRVLRRSIRLLMWTATSGLAAFPPTWATRKFGGPLLSISGVWRGGTKVAPLTPDDCRTNEIAWIAAPMSVRPVRY
jgi:hypothetical protein